MWGSCPVIKLFIYSTFVTIKVVVEGRDFLENESLYFVFVDLGEGGVVFWRRLCQFGPRSLVLSVKLQCPSFFHADEFLTQVMDIPFSGFTFKRPDSITEDESTLIYSVILPFYGQALNFCNYVQLITVIKIRSKFKFMHCNSREVLFAILLGH